MQLSDERIESLKHLLHEEGIEISNEEIHSAGLSILRFVVAKATHEPIINMETHDEQPAS